MLTLYFLQTSRAIRTAWLLEELNVEYDLKSAERTSDGSIPPELGVPTDFGKSPAIQDGDFVLGESGAIAELVTLLCLVCANGDVNEYRYICAKYDTHHRLLSTDPIRAAKIRELMWASEGNFTLHTAALLSARLAAPASALPEIEPELVKPIQNDLDWLEKILVGNSTKFLAGNDVTVADTMMIFPLVVIFGHKLGTEGKSWPRVNKWLQSVEASATYQGALQRTGHHV
jgi:glutathione S-transferase